MVDPRTFRYFTGGNKLCAVVEDFTDLVKVPQRVAIEFVRNPANELLKGFLGDCPPPQRAYLALQPVVVMC